MYQLEGVFFLIDMGWFILCTLFIGLSVIKVVNLIASPMITTSIGDLNLLNHCFMGVLLLS